MRYAKLGQTDIAVSEWALGCWAFGGGDVWGPQDEAATEQVVQGALAAGINFFDTAEGYNQGRSEESLGQALGARRGEAVIATKAGPDKLTADRLAAACDGSLQRLQTDYIDLYYIHWPNGSVPIDETLTAMERLRDQGKIRAVGVCNFGPLDLRDLLAVGRVEVDQIPYNLLWRVVERAIQPACLDSNIGLVCYSPLAQGLLSGRYAKADEVPEGIARTRHYAGHRPRANHGEAGCEQEVFAALDDFGRIAAGLAKPLAQVALAWVRQQAGVAALLVGARSEEELALNLPALDLQLDADTVAALDRAGAAVKAALGDNADMWMAPGRMR
ncbi:MAG: aldo/keto reductase [Candidatus Latescibacteria bacterium]|nr:aldo/keto reductase [Candidatus Latescibacterota bacterium]